MRLKTPRQIEIEALRHQHQVLIRHADAMSDELESLYRSSCEAGSPSRRIKAVVARYLLCRGEIGMRVDRKCPLLEVVNQ